MRISNDLDIRINTHELRILAVWASSWAQANPSPDGQMENVLAGVLHRLKKQAPGVPLTLADEYQQIADQSGGEVQCLDPSGQVETYLPRKAN